MKIQKLPPEVRTKLESGVRNSLDADASGIAVRVDLKNFYIKVTDNGKGIGKDDLELVGERFMTSKYQTCNNLNSSCLNYGYRGQALSSILDFCRSLTIKTKSKIDGPILVKVLRKSKAGEIAELNDDKCGIGTTVIIEDFMCTMPVRRNRIKEVYEMEEIKTQLQYLAIIHYNVCFTLRNENKNLILLQTTQASNMLEMISNLYGKTTAKSLRSVNYEENNYRITGYVSVQFSKQNNIQIVYINRQVITKGVIHKFIHNVMKEYCESKTLLSDSPAEHILKKFKNSHHTFIIEIKCPKNYYELFTNLKKTFVEFKNWKKILKCIFKGLKKTCKFDCTSLDDSLDCFEGEAGKFGTSVLINAVKGIPATRCFKLRKNDKKPKMEISKTALFPETYEDIKILMTDSKKKKNDNSAIDTLETPIPKNRKVVGSKKSKSTGSHPDMSYIEFYKWLKESFKTDPEAFNLYSDFLKHKNKAAAACESYKSPVLGFKSKEKRISSMKSKVPEKKQKILHKGSAILSKEITLMTQNSFKNFPNVNLEMKKAVQFNTEMDMFEFSNFNCENWKSQDEIFMKPHTTIKDQRQLRMVQTLLSPAPSEVHFTNVIRFRNLPESFHLDAIPLLPEKNTNTWMSHYQDVKEDNFINLPDNTQNFSGKSKVKYRDVTVQTSSLEVAQKMNAAVQTSQTPKKSSSNAEYNPLINNIAISDSWNLSTPENHLDLNAYYDINKIISPKTHRQIQSASGEFICSQSVKSHSNSKSNSETQALPHLWTESLSEFCNHIVQDSDSNGKPDSIPTTIPLEEINSPQFCLRERHDFVPKGLSPRCFSSEPVEIPNLDSPEKNRIQVAIHDVNNDMSTVKWRDESTGKCEKPAIPDSVDEMQLNAKKKSINFENQILSASLSYCAIKVHSLLHSFTFTKELLAAVEVLGQLDKKFIVTKMKISSPEKMELLSLLDQHAVDERIKLEKIINEYTKCNNFASTALSHLIELSFSESDIQALIDLEEKMTNFGFVIQPKNQKTVIVNSIPSFLSNKYKKEKKKGFSLKNFLRTVILEILNEITDTRGAVSKIPKIMHDAFISEACQRAVKFNKALSKETMTKMISDLKTCKLPFQCAHGRPSVIPIIDLEDFRSEEEEEYSVDFEKIKKFCHEKNNEMESLEKTD